MDVIKSIKDEKRFNEAKKILAKHPPLHCFKCGNTLPPPDVNPDGLILAKCSNVECREVSRFIIVKGKVKLITKKLLSKLRDEDLTPYTKTDILKLVVNN